MRLKIARLFLGTSIKVVQKRFSACMFLHSHFLSDVVVDVGVRAIRVVVAAAVFV